MPSPTDALESLMRLLVAGGAPSELQRIFSGVAMTARGIQDAIDAIRRTNIGSSREREVVAGSLEQILNKQASKNFRNLGGQRSKTGGLTGERQFPRTVVGGRGPRGGTGQGNRGRGGPPPGRGAEGSGSGGSGGPGIGGAIKLQRVQSSNVYAIGYDFDTGTLRVQFLAAAMSAKGLRGGSRRVGSVPGAVYDYYDVPPRLWEAFSSSSSKGGWVWDNLRIRGSISGHHFEYRLVSGVMTPVGKRGKDTIVKVYVPRLATGKGLVRRSRVIKGKEIRSSLPATFYNEGTGKKFFRGR